MEISDHSPKLPSIRTAMRMSRSVFVFPTHESEQPKVKHQRKAGRKPTLYPLDSLHVFQSHNFSINGAVVAGLFTTMHKKTEDRPKPIVVDTVTEETRKKSINSVSSFSEALKKKRLITINSGKTGDKTESNKPGRKAEARKQTRKATSFLPTVRLTKIDSCDLDSSTSDSEASAALQLLRQAHSARFKPPPLPTYYECPVDTTFRQINTDYELATAKVLGNTQTIAKRRSKAMVVPARLLKLANI